MSREPYALLPLPARRESGVAFDDGNVLIGVVANRRAPRADSIENSGAIRLHPPGEAAETKGDRRAEISAYTQLCESDHVCSFSLPGLGLSLLSWDPARLRCFSTLGPVLGGAGRTVFCPNLVGLPMLESDLFCSWVSSAILPTRLLRWGGSAWLVVWERGGGGVYGRGSAF